MQSVSTILVYLAFAGAVASWIAGAVFYVCALNDTDDASLLKRLAVPVWPFATGLVRGASEGPSLLSKAQIAFIACTLVGTAAFAASANLHRFAK